MLLEPSTHGCLLAFCEFYDIILDIGCRPKFCFTTNLKVTDREVGHGTE